MKIGILGSGHIGATVGSGWARASHDVRFSATNLDALAPLVQSLGPHASLGKPAEAVAFGEVVLIALPVPVVIDVLAVSGPLEGKVLIHAANGFGANALTLAALSERFPGSRCVRAYNTLQARVLENDGHREPAYALLLSGDDENAKRTVAALITDSGFAPVDIGGAVDAVLQDPGSPLWNNPLTEDRAWAAVEELRTTGHAGADPIVLR